MRATKNEERALEECMVRLYRKSKPKADWFEVKKEKGDFFLKYEIDFDVFENIIDSVIKEFNIKRSEAFRATIYLGASPRFSQEGLDSPSENSNFEE